MDTTITGHKVSVTGEDGAAVNFTRIGQEIYLAEVKQGVRYSLSLTGSEDWVAVELLTAIAGQSIGAGMWLSANPSNDVEIGTIEQGTYATLTIGDEPWEKSQYVMVPYPLEDGWVAELTELLRNKATVDELLEDNWLPSGIWEVLASGPPQLRYFPGVGED